MTKQILDPETGEFVDYQKYQDKQKAKRQATKAQVRWAGLKVAVYLQVAVLLLGVVIALIVTATGLPYERLTAKEFDATVTDRFLCGTTKTNYCVAVVLENGATEVLTNQNSLWWWKWRGADLEPLFQNGAYLHFKVYGWRFGWPWTNFRNIIAAEPIGQ